MSITGALRVECAEAFPFGVGAVSAVTAVVDFDASTKDRKVQAREKETGLPMWTVDVMDFDPDARERSFKVKIAAPVQPVPPEAVPGTPVRPVVLEGLTVMAYVKDKESKFPRLAYALRATGLAAPGKRASVPSGDASKVA